MTLTRKQAEFIHLTAVTNLSVDFDSYSYYSTISKYEGLADVLNALHAPHFCGVYSDFKIRVIYKGRIISISTANLYINHYYNNIPIHSYSMSSHDFLPLKAIQQFIKKHPLKSIKKRIEQAKLEQLLGVQEVT